MKTILILFDSLNKHFLPMYGKENTYAPNFERLAAKTASFNNSYVGSMPCIPARRDLHTGRLNFLHREWGPLEPFDNSLPDILKKQGVYTHLISDHIHYWEEGGANYHTKYNTWEIVRGQEGDHWKGMVKEPNIPDVVTVPKNQKGTGVSSMWRNDWVNREYMQNEKDQPMTKVMNLGCDFITENFESDNWFLQIETFDPHEPFYVMDHYLKNYETDYKGKHFDWPRGPVTETEEEVIHIRNQYKALVTMCDTYLGRVLDLMDRLNMWEDTMLIVGTDHGFMLGEHDYWAKNAVPYYDEVAQTPLFIYDPRSKQKGVDRNSLVQMIDWAPTILDFFNIEIPKEMTGKVLKETIKDDTPVRESAIFGVFSGHVNIVDQFNVYMRAAKIEKIQDIYNYTLVPVGMHTSYSNESLRKMELVEGFSFTKGLKLLKVPGSDKYNVNRFGTLLFDRQNDPLQLNPLNNEEIENKMIDKLIKHMEDNEAPSEQYERLGLR